MKKRNLSLIILLGLIILSANSGICADEIVQHIPAAADALPSKEAGVQITVTKFIVTMGGVVLSSILIWAGLSVYNKFFVKNDGRRGSVNDDILNTPKTISEAVTFFIKKNKLN